MMYDALLHMGVPVHHRDIGEVVEAIDGFVEEGRRTGRSHQIVTVNTDFLVQAWKHLDVHAILRSADLAVPDGMPIVWASAVLGQRLPGRVAGADLVPAIAERAALRGYRVMFFGGGEGVADRAAALMRANHPGLRISTTSGTIDRYGSTDPAVLAEIRSFAPDVICVALGHPKQERWIRRHAADLRIPVAIGVGGTFDFIAGERRRAPLWIQRTGLEWVFRLLQEPRRLSRRYLEDLAIYVPQMASQIVRARLASRTGDTPSADQADDLDLSGRLEIVEYQPGFVVLALSRPGPLDHHTIAALTSLATQTRRRGQELRLVVQDGRTMRSIERLRLDRLVSILPRWPEEPHAGRPRGPARGSRPVSAPEVVK